MHETLRIYDPHNNYIKLSEAFDYINKISSCVFDAELAHMMSFVEAMKPRLDSFHDIISKISDQRENVINRAPNILNWQRHICAIKALFTIS